MKKLIILLTFLCATTSSAYAPKAVVSYKSSISVSKIRSTSKLSLISKHSIQYPGIKVYTPTIYPLEFNSVIDTITTQKHVCRYGSFEYDLYINKTLWEMPAIQRSLKVAMKSMGFSALRVNDYGVILWGNSSKDYFVSFVTKLTPFTYVNSICRLA